MFDPTSRYYSLGTATLTTTDSAGQTRMVTYAKRRLVPGSDQSSLLLEHTVESGERIDGIVAQYLNDPTQYWRICDSNGVMRPTELTDTIGRVLRISTGRP
jgi:hypothetical protein